MRPRKSKNRWELSEETTYGERAELPTTPSGWGSLFSGSLLGGFSRYQNELAGAQEAVADEQQSAIAIVSRTPEANAHLLGLLRQETPPVVHEEISREGFFTLIALSDELSDEGYTHSGGGEGGDLWPFAPEDPVQVAGEHDLILYVVQRGTHWGEEDARWLSRLRATRVALLPVLGWDGESGADQLPVLADVRRKTGIRPVILDTGLSASGPDIALSELIERILSLRPRLSIPLAQESPAFRRSIARRVIRTGSLMTMLLGTEPIPLLDLPFHIALQWKVALQLATIYGRPGLDYRSREMGGAVLFSLIVRHLAGQVIKLVPLVGWLLSGLLSGISTFLLGETLVRYYEEDLHFPLSAQKVAALGRSFKVGRPRPSHFFNCLFQRIARRGQGSALREPTVQDIPLENPAEAEPKGVSDEVASTASMAASVPTHRESEDGGVGGAGIPDSVANSAPGTADR